MNKFLCVLLFMVGAIAAAQTGRVVGTIYDKDSGEERLTVPFASVVLKDTQLGAQTDIDGKFNIVAPVGTYTLVASFVGMQTIEVPNVVVRDGFTTTVDIDMAAESAALEAVSVVVRRSRESAEALLEEQKKSVTIVQSIGAQELSQKGVSDASGAVAKISGVSKQESSSNVYVRGLGDRYQNSSLNGLSLPSTDVNKKNIDLDIFSSDVIESIDVSKAYDVRFFGDFSAGNVNVRSKKHTGNSFLNVTLGTGANTNAIGEDFVRLDGASYAGYYNKYDNDPFAVLLSHSVDPVDGFEPVNIDASIDGGHSFRFDNGMRLSLYGSAAFTNGSFYQTGVARDFTNVLKVNFPTVEEYNYTARTTAQANIDFTLDDNNSFKFVNLFVNKSANGVSNYGINGQGFNRDANDSEDGYFVRNTQFNQDRVHVTQLLGEHDIQETLAINWGAAYNKVFSDEPDRRRNTLEDYQFALDNDPETNPNLFSNIAFDNQRFTQSVVDDEITGFLNIEKTVNENLKFNLRYSGRRKERDFTSYRYGYEVELNGRDVPVLDVNNLDDIFNVRNIGTQFNTIVLNPISNEIGNTNVPGLPENIYNGQMDIHGVSANAQITTGKLLLIPGLRVETWDQSITYDVVNLPPNDPGSRSVYENIILPSINAKYSLTEDINLRASYSQTASLPEFKEVAPFVYEDVTVRYGGNPDLIGGRDGSGPTYSTVNNFDLKFEYFFNQGEILSIGTFYKKIDDPVNRVVAADATGTQRYFRTGDSADVLGVELEARVGIVKDLEEDNVLVAGVNAAYTYTNQDLKDITGDNVTYTTSFDRDEIALEGASPFIINADLTYTPTLNNYKPTASLVGSYFSDRISAIGAGSLGDIIEKSVFSLDFVYSSPLSDNLTFKLSAKNLINPDIEYVREETSSGDITISSFKLGVNLGMSLKYQF
ncbi:TonB-dependent receptor [Nonlabens ponticola]|uniref:TonB-dependent receptor n=1 Tax=Nonlabens ponticola TaxID=2496866 RepID=A0A3S9MUT6_9FLAO|nr:TonB-dependent receptor [Nonlabens ponticola]AZQ42946.1 TonB-dependent receptor [Nonlabens ponticola]